MLPLAELHYTRLQIVEGEEGKPIVIEGVASIADKINANGRVYPYAVLEAAAKKVSENLDRHPGLVDHPEGPSSVADAGIRYTELYMDGKELKFRGEIIPTRKGMDLAAVVKSGIEVGISTRGYGSVVRGQWEGKDCWIIQDDYTLEAPDACLDPSVEDARILKAESIDWQNIILDTIKLHREDLVEMLMEKEEKTQENESIEKLESESLEVEETKTEEVGATEEPLEEKQEESVSVEEVRATLTNALAEMTAKYEETAVRLSEVESERSALAESVENFNTILTAIASQIEDDLANENFYAVSNLAWMGADCKWMRDSEAYKAALAATGSAESALKRVAQANLEGYIREKCRPERIALPLADALVAVCQSKEDVDSKFDEMKTKIESELAGLNKPVTKGEVNEPEPVRHVPKSVERAVEYIEKARVW
jgi:hypothetical protein